MNVLYRVIAAVRGSWDDGAAGGCNMTHETHAVMTTLAWEVATVALHVYVSAASSRRNLWSFFAREYQIGHGVESAVEDEKALEETRGRV